MKPLDRLISEFRCPKCRHSSAVAHEVTLPRKSNRIPIVGGQENYAFVSCTLCGYTETYNLKIVVRQEEAVRAPAREAAQPVKPGS